MKKHLLTTTAALAVIGGPASASSYVTGFGGINMLDNEAVSLAIFSSVYHTAFTEFAASPSQYTVRYEETYGYAYLLDGEIDIDNGFVIGAALGMEVAAIPGLSVEGELAYRKNDFDLEGTLRIGYFENKYTTVWHNPTTLPIFYATDRGTFISTSTDTSIGGDVTAFSIMANLWWEFGGSGALTPYIGGGIGWAKVEVDVEDFNGDDSGLAWQLGIGVSYAMSDTTSLRLEYRRFQVNDLDINHDGMPLGIEDYEADDIIVGVKMKF